MPRDKLRHLEHADLALAIEDWLQRIVGIDLGSLLFVLEPIFLDVIPKFFGELGTWQGLGTDNFRKFFVWLDRPHEGGIRFAFGRGLGGGGFGHKR